MKRGDFIHRVGLATLAMTLAPKLSFAGWKSVEQHSLFSHTEPLSGEDIFSYILRSEGHFDLGLYRKLLGYCNEFKEGDDLAGIAAPKNEDRVMARALLAQTRLKDVVAYSVFKDQQAEYIFNSTSAGPIQNWRFEELKTFLLHSSEIEIKSILPQLHSDHIACVVKLMSNEELIVVSNHIFNPLPGSNIGMKGYMGARVQPNSPTDHPEDIFWQVMNAWSFGVGDVVLGTNPVSSELESVARIESTLQDIIETFSLQNAIPHCVLAHIDVQAQVEAKYPGTTGIWFQSIAGTDAANQTFDLTLEKLKKHTTQRNGKYGLYAETGQGADETNGHGEGFDMLIHESRKYGLMRGLKHQIEVQKGDQSAWVHVNDVAGFIGPEVFRTKEQLVRCCLEDIVMGKLHGLTIGLDICTTLHMDVSLDDLDWCIDQIMPANPAYLMALPTKNDPMLSYLTTSFVDHVRVREKFGYKVSDVMWDFFKSIQIIDQDNKPTAHFSNPVWVYYQYLVRKGDQPSWSEVEQEGLAAIERVRSRGVPIAVGHGSNMWDLSPALDAEVRELYHDAKKCIWQEWPNELTALLSAAVVLETMSADRKDYIYHPQSGEQLTSSSITVLEKHRRQMKGDYQIIVSDGLNVLSITDDGHLTPYLEAFRKLAGENGISVSPQNIQIKNGRVRAGYQCGKVLFSGTSAAQPKGVIHIIGERPGTKHHSYSVYLTIASTDAWTSGSKIDHDITKVISGISNTSLLPAAAALETIRLITEFRK